MGLPRVGDMECVSGHDVGRGGGWRRRGVIGYGGRWIGRVGVENRGMWQVMRSQLWGGCGGGTYPGLFGETVLRMIGHSPVCRQHGGAGAA